MSLTSNVSIMLMRHRGRQDGVGGRRLCWPAGPLALFMNDSRACPW